MPDLPIIENIKIYQCQFVSKGFNYSTWSNTINQTVVYEISSNGIVGWGEATAKFNALSTAKRIARRIIGRPLIAVESLLDPRILSGNLIYDWYVGFDRRVRQVREGYSFALYDLLGKLNKKSIYELVGREKRKECISVMPVIHVNEPDIMRRIAESWFVDGYRMFKVKLRGNAAKDVAAVTEILGISNDIKIIVVDANYGYNDTNSLILAGKEMARLGVMFFQNPIKRPLRTYQHLSNQMGLQFTCDNTAYWPNIRRVLKSNAAHVTNIHPNCMGGVDLMYKTIDFSANAGVNSIMGSSGFFGIQDRAYQKLAFTLNGDLPSEEIGMNPYFEGGRAEFYSYEFGLPELVTNRLAIRNGKIFDDNCFGFGIEVDRDKLQRVVLNQFTLNT